MKRWTCFVNITPTLSKWKTLILSHLRFANVRRIIINAHSIEIIPSIHGPILFPPLLWWLSSNTEILNHNKTRIRLTCCLIFLWNNNNLLHYCNNLDDSSINWDSIWEGGDKPKSNNISILYILFYFRKSALFAFKYCFNDKIKNEIRASKYIESHIENPIYKSLFSVKIVIKSIKRFQCLVQ